MTRRRERRREIVYLSFTRFSMLVGLGTRVMFR
jgi:hypothetical protein